MQKYHIDEICTSQSPKKSPTFLGTVLSTPTPSSLSSTYWSKKKIMLVYIMKSVYSQVQYLWIKLLHRYSTCE